MKGKLGISAIIATVLIILITVVATGIIWLTVVPMVEDISNTEDLGVKLEIKTDGGYTFYDEDTGYLHVQVSRGADETDLTGLKFVVTINGSSTTYPNNPEFPDDIYEAPIVNGKITYIIPVDGRPDSIKVIPVIGKDSVEKESSAVSKAGSIRYGSYSGGSASSTKTKEGNRVVAPVCGNGEFGICDDGNECTRDYCDVDVGCNFSNSTGVLCEDGTKFCSAGECLSCSTDPDCNTDCVYGLCSAGACSSGSSVDRPNSCLINSGFCDALGNCKDCISGYGGSNNCEGDTPYCSQDACVECYFAPDHCSGLGYACVENICIAPPECSECMDDASCDFDECSALGAERFAAFGSADQNRGCYYDGSDLVEPCQGKHDVCLYSGTITECANYTLDECAGDPCRVSPYQFRNNWGKCIVDNGACVIAPYCGDGICEASDVSCHDDDDACPEPSMCYERFCNGGCTEIPMPDYSRDFGKCDAPFFCNGSGGCIECRGHADCENNIVDGRLTCDLDTNLCVV